MTRKFLPNFYASLESSLKMMKNGLNNLFTADLVSKLSSILYFCVMMSLYIVVLTVRWQQEEESLISQVIQRN